MEQAIFELYWSMSTVSKSMFFAPDLPEIRESQNPSLPIPMGVTGPRPVITTLFFIGSLSAMHWGWFFYSEDNSADGFSQRKNPRELK